MTPRFWAFTLQWSRIGVNTAVFLLAARFLTLSEIGSFATVFAPIKLAQGVHKVGIVEAVLIRKPSAIRLNAMFGFSIVSGLLVAAAFCLFAQLTNLPWSLSILGLIPIFLGFSAVSEGLLRKQMRFRAMATRTLFSQGVAGFVTFFAISKGAGAEALVAFAMINVTLSALVSITLAGWWPSANATTKQMLQTSKLVLKIAGRDTLNSGVLPMAQIAIGLRFGLAEAGAFQIALRMLGMIDALTLSPLRLHILPHLAGMNDREAFKKQTIVTFKLSMCLSCWIVFGAAAVEGDFLVLLIGNENATTSAPAFTALIPLSLCAAAAMPFAQALIADGHVGFVLKRAVVLMTLSAVWTLGGLFYSALGICIALTLAGLSTLIWFLLCALPRLGHDYSALLIGLVPIAAGAIMWGLLYGLDLEILPAIIIGTAVYIATLNCAFFANRGMSQK